MKAKKGTEVSVRVRKKTLYVVDVPKPFIEYCIKNAENKEHKKELKKLLEGCSETS